MFMSVGLAEVHAAEMHHPVEIMFGTACQSINLLPPSELVLTVAATIP